MRIVTFFAFAKLALAKKLDSEWKGAMNHMSPEFMRGAQEGMFAQPGETFDEYSCPEPTL